MRDNKGRFTKDNPGRPKGAKDKLTQEAKELFIQTLESQVEHIKDAFECAIYKLSHWKSRGKHMTRQDRPCGSSSV